MIARRSFALATIVVVAAGCGGPPAPARSAEASSSPAPTATSATPAADAARTIQAPQASAPVSEPAAKTAGQGGSPAGGAPEQGGAPGGPATAERRGDKPGQISARHILIQYMGAQHADSSIVRTKEQALLVAQEVLRRARSGEDFVRLVVEYSDEPGAGSRGGSLGRFGHGQMVHEFDDAAFALSPGQLSGIVESPFGYHIIQRTE